MNAAERSIKNYIVISSMLFTGEFAPGPFEGLKDARKGYVNGIELVE